MINVICGIKSRLQDFFYGTHKIRRDAVIAGLTYAMPNDIVYVYGGIVSWRRCRQRLYMRSQNHAHDLSKTCA